MKLVTLLQRGCFAASLLFLHLLASPQQNSHELKWPAVTAETRPWTRWWWMGNAVDKKDLTSNMEKYRDIGFGGLELTPVYGVKGYEAQFIPYLSPKWMDMLEHTLKEAGRLGLGIDMANGTGWPFGGGPLIDSTYACKDFVYKIWSLHTGETLMDTVQYLQQPLVRTDGIRKPDIDELKEPVFASKDLQALALFQVKFRRALPLVALMAYSTGRILDLRDKVDASGHLQWVAPEGSWTLYAIFRGWHGKMVERAAPGGEGNVIDHFSQAALTRYLSRFDTAFRGHDLKGLRAFFNDSYEVDDAQGQSNWTPDFFEAFSQRRGYDLREHLPALLGKDTKENNERVLCDYRETISDLLLEKFTLPWRNWAKGKGAVIRNQAHGSPANILDLYAASDIPETEGEDIFRYKFATSAAHVSGKKLVSSESLTWLNEHFLSTLSDEKKVLDNYLLGGVNHIFYHGTAYSPANDPWPGWLFYASVHFTPDDPCWRNFPALNHYVTRCQSFLQQGTADNDVLMYYPLYDSWSKPGAELLKHYDRMAPEFRGTGFAACATLMQEKGYAFDYISDRQLQQTTAKEKGIMTGGGVYKTVVIPGCRYISAAAFDRLVQLATSGVNIIFYKDLPVDVPGWNAQERRRTDFQALRDRIKASGLRLDGQWTGIEKSVVDKGAFLWGDDLGRLLAYARIRRETMVDDSLQFVRRRYGQGHCYFLVNGGSKKWEGFVPLAAAFSTAAIFNPMNGVNGAAQWRPAGTGEKEIYLQLLPGESCLVQTFASPIRAPAYPYYRKGDPSPVNGSWKIEFIEGGPVLPGARTTEQLGSWTMLGEKEKNFSGTAKYSIHIRRPPGSPARSAAWLLNLGKVHESVRVSLNGKKIADLIGPYYEVVIPDTDMRDDNLLEVEVSNLMVNRIEYMDRQGVNWKKFYNYNFPPHAKENRGPNGLFDASKWAPVESGLLGPVTLTPLNPRTQEARTQDGEADPAWTKQAGAKNFPSSKEVYKVNDYGAAKDGATLATRAIQAAIDDCAKKGGGRVIFEPGIYLSGALFLKEGVELQIGKEVELRGSQRFEDYPEIDTRIAGIEMKWPAALLNIIGVKNAAVTGEGRVDARGKFCWDKYWAMRREYDPRGLRWIVDYDARRVRTLLIQRSSDVTIKDVRFFNAGFWTVQVLYSDHVTVDGIVIRNNEDGHGPSTDGVDIDSSTGVLVEHCDIDCNDDDFCLKAGRDWDGLRVNRPTEYVVIRNCIARKGGGLLTIGSETSGGIRHVLARDLEAKGTGSGFRIKSATTRGGTIEDIHLRNIRMDSVGTAIHFTLNWYPAYSYSSLPKGYSMDSVPEHWKTILHKVAPPEKGIPHVRDIFISDMHVGSAKKAISATGLQGSLITGVHMKNTDIAAATAGEIDYAKDWDLEGAHITAKDGGTVAIKHYEQAAAVQEQPKQKDVLQSMRLANTCFMNKWPDPGKEIITNTNARNWTLENIAQLRDTSNIWPSANEPPVRSVTRPSNIWTRSVYYEGLMALYSIDPQKKYYDYAVEWGDKHQWTPRPEMIAPIRFSLVVCAGL